MYYKICIHQYSDGVCTDEWAHTSRDEWVHAMLLANLSMYHNWYTLQNIYTPIFRWRVHGWMSMHLMRWFSAHHMGAHRITVALFHIPIYDPCVCIPQNWDGVCTGKCAMLYGRGLLWYYKIYTHRYLDGVCTDEWARDARSNARCSLYGRGPPFVCIPFP